MALRQKVYGIQMPFSVRIFCVHGIFSSSAHSRKPVVPQSEIGNLGRLQLKLQFISDQGDELRIGRLALCIADGISEETLQGIQVASVPGDLNGMPDGTLHTAGRSLECFRHLGVEYLGDGIGGLAARQRGC